MRAKLAGLAAFGAAVMSAGSANAGVSDVYVGVFEHNACVLDCKNAFKEGEPNIEVQVSFDSPSFLDWAGSPKPMVMASVNTQGDTSYAGFGLDWQFKISDHFTIDPSFGYVVHDGELENPYPHGSPEGLQFAEEHVLLGSEDLFRTGLGLTYHMDGPWNVAAYYEHLSHGQVLGSGRNQGLDEFGIRIGYEFGD